MSKKNSEIDDMLAGIISPEEPREINLNAWESDYLEESVKYDDTVSVINSNSESESDEESRTDILQAELPMPGNKFPIYDIAMAIDRISDYGTSAGTNTTTINSAIYARLRMVKLKGVTVTKLVNAILLDFITKNREVLDGVSVKPLF